MKRTSIQGYLKLYQQSKFLTKNRWWDSLLGILIGAVPSLCLALENAYPILGSGIAGRIVEVYAFFPALIASVFQVTPWHTSFLVLFLIVEFGFLLSTIPFLLARYHHICAGFMVAILPYAVMLCDVWRNPLGS